MQGDTIKRYAIGTLQAHGHDAAENERIACDLIGGAVVLGFMGDEDEIRRQVGREFVMDDLGSEGIDGGTNTDGRGQINKAMSVPMDIDPAGHGHRRRRGVGCRIIGIIGQFSRGDRQGPGRNIGRGRCLRPSGTKTNQDEEQDRIKTHLRTLADQAARKMKFLAGGIPSPDWPGGLLDGP